MLPNEYPLHRSESGFSLVEIMIAMVIGMLGILIIMQTFLMFEGQKRTTTGTVEAQENALMALFTMERDLQMAGLGLVGLGCTTINAYNANRTPAIYSFNAWPVTITQGNPAAGTDRITLVYSASAFGNIPTTITKPMPPSSSILNAANGDGFIQDDLFVLSEPGKPCTLAQATQNGQQTGATWNIQVNPASPYNQASGGIFPQSPPYASAGYVTGARLTNMGRMVNHAYFVQNNTLMMSDVNLPAGAANPLALVNGIVAIRAQYGRDTNADGFVDVYDNTPPASATDVVAVQLAVVARSGQFEKDVVTPGNPPGSLVLWNGGTIANGGALDLSATGPLGLTAQQYRYKIYQTTIPLRNVLWNN